VVDTPKEPVLCAACVHWSRSRDDDGICRRRAPHPGVRGEEVAHWPRTRGVQGCGDGALAPAPAAEVTCGNCVFWRRPAHGFSPVDRGDMPMAWWTHAGYCGRHAPRPATEPGARAFWRATSSADGCGEGALRSDQAAASE
jgi:hypothetical protein